MAVEKFSISFDPELLAMVREAADDDDETLSAWMAAAARQRIRHVALGHAVDALLAEAGLTEEEALAAAAEARSRAIRTGGPAPATKSVRSKAKAPARRAKSDRPSAGRRSSSKRKAS